MVVFWFPNSKPHGYTPWVIVPLILLKLQGEGEFKGLEGIAVNSKGNILVADRENHRVQIF